MIQSRIQNFNEHMMHLPTQLKLPAAQGRPPQHNAPSAGPEALAGPMLTIQNHKWKVAAVVLQNIILSVSTGLLLLGISSITAPHHAAVTPTHLTHTANQLRLNDNLGEKTPKSASISQRCPFGTELVEIESPVGRPGLCQAHTYTQSLNLSGPPAL